MAHRIYFILVFIFLNYVRQSLCDDECKYRASFCSGAESCPDFTNDKFNADKMELAQMESEDEDGAGLMCIEGSLELTIDIDEDVMIGIDINKETSLGSEPMFSVLMGICECLKDEDAPWKAIFKAMSIESCPIKAGTYDVKAMVIDLAFAKDMLTHEYCGEYGLYVNLLDGVKNTIACYSLGMSIDEI